MSSDKSLGGFLSEDSTQSILDIEEEMVDECLNKGTSVRGRERAQSDCDEPDMEVSDGKPGLKGWRERQYLFLRQG